MGRLLPTGALLLGVGASAWAIDSARYGDWGEAVWCGLVGVGWLLLAWGLGLAGARRAAVGGFGLLAAAVGATHWMLGAGSPGSAWVFYGLGMDLAAVAALLGWAAPAWRGRAAWAFPVAFGLVFVAAVKLAARGPWTDLFNAVALMASLAGAVLVLARPVGSFEQALAAAA